MEKVSQITNNLIRIGFFLLFILVPLILTPWNYELFEYNKMMMTYGLTAVILGAWIINMIAAKEVKIRKTPLDLPIALFVLSQLVSTLFSMDPHISWFGYYSRFNGGMMSVLTYVALYYAFVSNFSQFSVFGSRFSDISQPVVGLSVSKTDKQKTDKHTSDNRQQKTDTIHSFLKVILITGLIVSLYGIAEHFGIDKHLWVQDVQNRVFSTLGQPNWLAAYLIALIPVSMGFGLWNMAQGKSKLVIETGNWKREKNTNKFSIFDSLPLSTIFYFLLAIIFFLTLLWTRSRSGFAALFIADLAFWGIIFLKGRPLPRRPASPNRGEQAGLKGVAFQRMFLRPFLFIHIVFAAILFINGAYIEQIDKYFTFKGLRQQFINRTIDQRPLQKQDDATESPDNPTIPAAGPLLESGVTDSGDIRKYVWQGAINAWKSSPKAFLIGTGTETFAFAFYQYKPIGHNMTSEWDFLYNKAHNEYLNFLATTGILGLGTYLILIGTFILWSLKFLIKISNLPDGKAGFKFQIGNNLPMENYDLNQIVFIGLFSGWISILITNFFGFSVVITQLMLYLFPAIMVSMTSQESRYAIRFPFEQSLKWQKRAMMCVGVISALLIVLVIIGWLSDKQFARGYHLARAGYLPQAYQALTSAINLNPTEPLFHDEQGNVLSTLALSAWKENQATTSRELAAMSIKENDIALRISPNNVNFWKSRTKIFYALSAIDPQFLNEAITALEKGLMLSPTDPKMYYNLAILYGTAGLQDKSLEYMKKSVELKPNYREGYFGLSVLYRELNRTEEANAVLREYLEKVDPTDEEFKELIQ